MQHPSLKATLIAMLVLGVVIVTAPLNSSADALNTMITKFNALAGITTDGQIAIEDADAVVSPKKCGTPDTEIDAKLLRMITAVVSTQDGQTVRLTLGKCSDLRHTCLTLSSPEAIQRFHAWNLQALDSGKSGKKNVSIELQGLRYFLRDVTPQSMSIQEYPNSTNRIYEFKIGSVEASRN